MISCIKFRKKICYCGFSILKGIEQDKELGMNVLGMQVLKFV